MADDRPFVSKGIIPATLLKGDVELNLISTDFEKSKVGHKSKTILVCI